MGDGTDAADVGDSHPRVRRAFQVDQPRSRGDGLTVGMKILKGKLAETECFHGKGDGSPL